MLLLASLQPLSSALASAVKPLCICTLMLAHTGTHLMPKPPTSNDQLGTQLIHLCPKGLMTGECTLLCAVDSRHLQCNNNHPGARELYFTRILMHTCTLAYTLACHSGSHTGSCVQQELTGGVQQLLTGGVHLLCAVGFHHLQLASTHSSPGAGSA